MFLFHQKRAIKKRPNVSFKLKIQLFFSVGIRVVWNNISELFAAVTECLAISATLLGLFTLTQIVDAAAISTATEQASEQKYNH